MTSCYDYNLLTKNLIQGARGAKLGLHYQQNSIKYYLKFYVVQGRFVQILNPIDAMTRRNNYFFMLEEASQVESGSSPAGSFWLTTTKMPFSLYVVYKVKIIISTKYVPTHPIKTGLPTRLKKKISISNKLEVCSTSSQMCPCAVNHLEKIVSLSQQIGQI